MCKEGNNVLYEFLFDGEEEESGEGENELNGVLRKIDWMNRPGRGGVEQIFWIDRVMVFVEGGKKMCFFDFGFGGN